MTILIVDDEPDFRESLAELFEDEGYVVARAADGREALAYLADEDLPEVVVLDLLMPGISGNEVYERMQRDARLARIPVIVATSDPSRAPSNVLTLKKPPNLLRLLGAVRSYCGANHP